MNLCNFCTYSRIILYFFMKFFIYFWVLKYKSKKNKGTKILLHIFFQLFKDSILFEFCQCFRKSFRNLLKDSNENLNFFEKTQKSFQFNFWSKLIKEFWSFSSTKLKWSVFTNRTFFTKVIFMTKISQKIFNSCF